MGTITFFKIDLQDPDLWELLHFSKLICKIRICGNYYIFQN
ncbi:hypothetical protein LEP1GSC104_3317 [Leptospira interrogans str. UI 12621]|uniref:Uncharacterized protein n=1 Tax=Leptospira interrogans str. UI 12621 TaxID=1049937 RepID=A0A0F6HCY3_LEPIR|nr:hypothetical protein LEP1GSC104_3317 [Leptospira interrogans str. UI 12621]